MKVKMDLVTVLVFCIGISFSYATRCSNLSGIWQNELGSRMKLVHEYNRISGEYYTAVETDQGAAEFVSNLTGLYSKQHGGSVLAFSVLFNRGQSLASWVGQCMFCGAKEVLQMTYMLRRYVPNQRDKWSSVIVNQNSFWRLEEEAESTSNSLLTSASTVKSKLTETPPGGLDLSGKWISSDSEEIEFGRRNEHILEGKYHMIDMVGRQDGNNQFTAVTFMSTNDKWVRSWTGHIYASSGPKIMETSWLQHAYNPGCSYSRLLLRMGFQNFTRVLSESENIVNKSETFMDKLRKFFSNIF